MTKREIYKKIFFYAFFFAVSAFIVLVQHSIAVRAAFGDPDTTFGVVQSGKINDIFLLYSPEVVALQAEKNLF